MKQRAISLFFATFAFASPVLAEPMLALIGNPDASVVTDLTHSLPDSVFVTNAEDISNLDQVPNVVMQFMDQPDVAAAQTTLDALGQSAVASMHMIMVERASGFDWLGQLEVPENVWTTITIRSRDMMEIERIYSQTGISYDGTGVQYRIPSIATAALASLGRAEDRFGKISRLGVMDTNFLKSGASAEVQARLLRELNPDWRELSFDSFRERGLRDTRFLDDGLQTDIEAIAANLMIINCVGSDDWYATIGPEVYFQTFDLRN